MGKRTKIALAVVILSLSGVLAWQVLRQRDPNPIIQGKSLKFWLENYSLMSSEYDRAIKEAGTNAIPILLRMLRQRDSALKVELMALAQKQDWFEIHYVPALERNTKAYHAFRTLGESAKAAVPKLIEIYEKGISDESKAWSARSLGSLGPAAKQAVPALLRGATNSSAMVRSRSLEALGNIHSDMNHVVPVLIKSLTDTNASVQHSASTALACLGKDATPWVPALVKLLNNPNRGVESGAANALMSIDPDVLMPPAPNAAKLSETQAAARKAFVMKYHAYRVPNVATNPVNSRFPRPQFANP